MNQIQPIINCYVITTSFENRDNFSVTVTKDGREYVLLGPQIKWGVTGTGKFSNFKKINPSKLVFFVYSPNKDTQPTNLWIFKKINDAYDPKIARAQKRFLRASSLCPNMGDMTKAECAILKYKKSLDSLGDLSKIKHEDINNFLLLVKRNLFFIQMNYERQLYLSEEWSKEFDKPIKDFIHLYNDPKKIFSCFLQFVQYNREDPHPARCLTRAITHEVLEHPLLAAEAYLELLDQGIKDTDTCFKKIKHLIDAEKKKKSESFFDFLENLNRNLLVSLYTKTNNPFFERLIFDKDVTRMYFEKCLEIIKNNADKDRKRAKCFVCFALETNVENWLKEVFVPDLQRIGIKPIFGPWHLNHGENLNTFQSQIRGAKLVLVICTPRLKDICVERCKGALTGAAQEVQIAQERYNDEDKNGTLFTLILHGKRRDCIPTPILEAIFTGKLEVVGEKESDLYDYYSKAFRIFASLVKMKWPESSKHAGELKQAFVATAGKIVFSNEDAPGDLTKKVREWSEKRYRNPYLDMIKI